MKKIALFISLSLIFFSCSQNTNKNKFNFLINGSISNAPENTIIKLYFRSTDNIKLMDSTVIKDNKFTLRGKSSGLDFFVLEFSGSKHYIYIIADSADAISINVDYKNIRNYNVQNSIHSKLIQTLENQLNKTDSLITAKLKKNQKIDTILEQQKDFSVKFIEKYDTSLSAIIALSEKFITGEPVLPIDENYNLFKKVEKKLMLNYGSTEYYKQFAEFIKNYEIQINRNKPIETNQNPTELIDFSIRTINGENFSLSSLKGNYILLNFWASWCLSCPNNNQIIKEIENKHKNIKIVQISLDSDLKILNDTLKKYNFSHILINDKKVWQSDIIKKYHIKKLPTNIIFDKKGKIILFTDNPNELFEFIEKLTP